MCPPSTSRRIGLLLSGGLDSCVLLGDLLQRGHRVRPIYIESGLFWQQAELASLHRFLEGLRNPDVEPLTLLQMPLDDVYRHHWSLTGEGVPGTESHDEAVYLPGRNALLLVKAILWCQTRGITNLAMGILGTSPFVDAGADFFAQFTGAMNMALDSGLRLHLPFAGSTKQDVMGLGRNLPLKWTFSCLSPQQQLHCGQCNKCVERRLAFEEAGFEDPTHYAYTVPTTR